jgi:CheY-like chemotaxis protein
MAKEGPIVVVEDDEDDVEIIRAAIYTIGLANRLKIFPNGHAAHEFLQNSEETPFLILCDVNMPLMNGFELKRKLNEAQHKFRGVPFVYLTTSESNTDVIRGYDLTIQGFFQKPADYEKYHGIIHEIIDYWQKAKHPY